MNEERKKFVEAVADAIKDMRQFAEAGFANAVSALSLADAVGQLRAQIDAAVAALRDALSSDIEQARIEARSAAAAGDAVARARVAELETKLQAATAVSTALREHVDGTLAAAADSVAESLETAKTAQDALETRLEGVESSAAENASQRAAAAVAGAIAEARADMVRMFGDLQAQVIGFQQKTLEAVAAYKPAPGAPGRDGKMAAPVPFEAGKAYRFNDWVRHAGGLWHCYRDTDAVPDPRSDCGWTLLTNGVTGVMLDAIPEDPRQFVLTVRLASGDVERMEFRVPGMIHRGVWREAERYDDGDVVTHDGSSWVAKRVSIGVKPGTPDAVDAWMLHVKRGKNGINASAERGLRWRGKWEAGMRCESNDLVRTKNAVWICLRATNEPPSEANTLCWAIFFGGE